MVVRGLQNITPLPRKDTFLQPTENIGSKSLLPADLPADVFLLKQGFNRQNNNFLPFCQSCI